MDAYDYCKHLVENFPDRWTGSRGERESGDWMEAQLARMGYDTRQTRFDCPGWEYEGEEVEVTLSGPNHTARRREHPGTPDSPQSGRGRKYT